MKGRLICTLSGFEPKVSFLAVTRVYREYANYNSYTRKLCYGTEGWARKETIDEDRFFLCPVLRYGTRP